LHAPYQPLHVQPPVKSEHRAGQPIFAALQGFVRRFSDWCTSDEGRKRLQLEAQLNSRHSFPDSDWLRAGFAPEEVLPYLLLIQEELSWPNCHFIPDDPVFLAFFDLWDFADLCLLEAFESRFGVHFTAEELASYNAASPLSEFIRAAHQRVTRRNQ
jgi:hypothetical protein